MAEGQFFFWVWNQQGKNNKRESFLDYLSKDDDDEGTSNAEQPEPKTNVDDTPLLVEDAWTKGSEGVEMNVLNGDGQRSESELPPYNMDGLPAYMVDEEFGKDDVDDADSDDSYDSDDDDSSDSEKECIDYNFTTMSTVKDETVLKFKGNLQSPPQTPSVSEMAIHDNCDNFLVHRESQPQLKEKKKSKRRCICISILCFLIILLSAAIVLFLLLYYWDVLGRKSDTSVIRATNEPGEGQTITIDTPPIALILVNISIVLQREYHIPSSEQSNELSAEIIETMSTVFRQSPKLNEVYDKTEVSKLRNNTEQTVGVDLIVYFNDSPVISIVSDGNDPPSGEDILDLIRSVLEDIISDMFVNDDTVPLLNEIDYLEGSVEIEEPLIILALATTISYTTSKGATLMHSTTEQINTATEEMDTTISYTTSKRPTLMYSTTVQTNTVTEEMDTATETLLNVTWSTPANATESQGCDGFLCGDGACISAALECDKRVHCNDTSDELNCTHDGCVEWIGTTAVQCNLPYNETYYPNFVSKGAPSGFENIIQAELQLRQLYRSRQCDERAIQLFCGAIFPGCPYGPSGVVSICKEFCEQLAVKTRCVDGFNSIQLNLTEICENAPTIPIDESSEFCTYF